MYRFIIFRAGVPESRRGWLAAGVGLMLTGCAGLQTAPYPEPEPLPSSRSEGAQESVSAAALREHTADAVFEVLAGEIAVQRGDLDVAYEHYLEAARVAAEVGGIDAPVGPDIALAAAGGRHAAGGEPPSIRAEFEGGQATIRDTALSAGYGADPGREETTITAGDAPCRLLWLQGRAISEPVAKYGPFVMNSREEIEQAMRDYRDGRLVQRKANMVSNLLVVLCGEENARPVVNTGSLYS